MWSVFMSNKYSVHTKHSTHEVIFSSKKKLTLKKNSYICIKGGFQPTEWRRPLTHFMHWILRVHVSNFCMFVLCSLSVYKIPNNTLMSVTKCTYVYLHVRLITL